MPATGLRMTVPPIAGEPSPHGILGGCIEVVSDSDPHAFNGTQFLSLSCADANPWYDCPPDGSGLTNPVDGKVFDRPRSCGFDAVTAYAGVQCSTFGLTYDEARSRAMTQLAMGEQRVVEQHLLKNFLAKATTVDLTPVAGPLHIAQGLGVLEMWLGQNYGGQGVVHAPIGTAALLSMHSLVDFATEQSCPTTLAGNSIVLGAGYSDNLGPDGTAAAAGSAWLYITPPMRVRRTEPFLVQNAEWQTVNTRNNDRVALAESTFVPEVSCCMAAGVRVSLAACP
ncbi:hypothetical protein SEA_MISCHIEF19_16 [Streptomyces phage Mischief19]|nr:hypothetical protein SEA_MISCHIEF19_16 [Streptomyces phage Mischief19]